MVQKIASLVWLGLLLSLAVEANEPFLVIEPRGHVDRVWEVAFSSSGQHLFSAGEDKVVREWAVPSGELLRTFRGQIGPGPEGKLSALAVSHAGNSLAVAGFLDQPDGLRVGEIRIFDAVSGTLVGLLKGHLDVVLDLQFSPDDRWFASSGSDGTVRIWEPKSGELIHTLGNHQEAVYGLAFSPDGSELASACYDAVLRIWDVRTGQLRQKLDTHEAKIRCVAYSLQGNLLASGDTDGNVMLWDTTDWRPVRQLPRETDAVLALAFTPAGDQLAVGHQDGLTLHSLATDEETKRWDTDAFSLGMSPDGKYLATGGSSGRITLLSLPGGNVLFQQASVGIISARLAWGSEGRMLAFESTQETSRWSFDFDTLTLRNLTSAGAASIQPDVRWLPPITQWGAMALQRGQEPHRVQILSEGRIVADILKDPYVDGEAVSYAFTPKGNVVVGSTWTLTRHDGETGERLTTFRGHIGQVLSVAPSPDGKYLASAGSDRTLRFWDLSRGELLLSLFVTERQEWICWTPEGFYACSPGGDRLIGWHVNQGRAKEAAYYYASQFKARFYRPALVQQALADGRRDALDSRSFTFVRPPQIEILSPVNGQVLRRSPATVRLRMGSGEARAPSSLMLFVNGRPVVTRDLELVPDETLGQIVERQIPLVAGENVLSVMAATDAASSLPVNVTVTYLPEKMLAKPNLYLLAVGVSAYPKKAWALQYADDDARSITALFEQQRGKLYANVHTRMLTDADATRNAILDGLEWLARSVTQRDVAIVFVSGHGVQDRQKRYYFVPVDGDAQHLLRSGVRWYDFQDVLRVLPCRVLLFVDTCHAGSVTGAKGVPSMDAFIRDLADDESGVVVMAASTGAEISVEMQEYGHGAFTVALLEGLDGKADFNADGAVYLTELDAYVTERVKEITNGAQHPTTQKPSTIRSFPVVVNE